MKLFGTAIEARVRNCPCRGASSDFGTEGVSGTAPLSAATRYNRRNRPSWSAGLLPVPLLPAGLRVGEHGLHQDRERPEGRCSLPQRRLRW
jgi:hypothetical protein